MRVRCVRVYKNDKQRVYMRELTKAQTTANLVKAQAHTHIDMRSRFDAGAHLVRIGRDQKKKHVANLFYINNNK